MLEGYLISLMVMTATVAIPTVRESGIATAYTVLGGDVVSIRGKRVRLSPGRPACAGLGWPIKSSTFLVAHRSLPCGMQVLVHNPRTKRFAEARVLDRGTFGAVGCHLPQGLRCVSCRAEGARPGWCIKIRRAQPGRWRGIADLSFPLANAIGLRAPEKIQILYTEKARLQAKEEWYRRRGRPIPQV
jgi:hypothetical protein